MGKSATLIYAAGIGSRMEGITGETNKCIIDLGGITPLLHTMRSFEMCGVNEVYVVVGYFADKVRETVLSDLADGRLRVNVSFLMNDKYDFHGCEFSLACAHDVMEDYDTVYITEGDMLLDMQYMAELTGCAAGNAALIRGKKYIIPEKSVAACTGSGGGIEQFVYDDMHRSLFEYMPPGMQAAGESMQAWKFSGNALEYLRNYYRDYYAMACQAKIPLKENGLEGINRTCREYPMEPVQVEGSRCINLNTVADVEKAQAAAWLNRDKEKEE